MGSESPVSSVCIATFRRPDGLRKLLQSLVAQRGAPVFEVVIIDNDSAGSARATAGEFSGALNLSYAVEPERGLAAARNHAVNIARGEFLAFVDDDETVCETWLATLHRVLAGTKASAVFGPVEVEFESSVEESIRRCRFFARPHPPEGEPIPWYFTHTGNALVRTCALPDRPAPFRSLFGLTGGEDIDLFKRISDAGGSFVAAGMGAGTREFRERERASFWWALRRSVRNGGNLADLQWRDIPRRERRKLARSAFATALRKGIYAMKEKRRDKLRFVELCIDATEEAGRALSILGYRYAEYGSKR
jgi:glycosyltransferase involved in cell wall biosynthesis